MFWSFASFLTSCCMSLPLSHSTLDTGLHWPLAVSKLPDTFPCQGFCTYCSCSHNAIPSAMCMVHSSFKSLHKDHPSKNVFVLIIFSKIIPLPSRIHFLPFFSPYLNSMNLFLCFYLTLPQFSASSRMQGLCGVFILFCFFY